MGVGSPAGSSVLFLRGCDFVITVLYHDGMAALFLNLFDFVFVFMAG